MKIALFILIGLGVVFGLAGLYFGMQENEQDGQNVQNGQTTGGTTGGTTGATTGGTIDDGFIEPSEDARPVSYTPSTAENLIEITKPAPHSIITSPLIIEGKARGTWLFEATAPVALVNWDGLIIAEGYIEAKGEWMTEEFVPVSGELVFTKQVNLPSNRATLILHKSNASGLSEHDAAMEIPVLFSR